MAVNATTTATAPTTDTSNHNDDIHIQREDSAQDALRQRFQTVATDRRYIDPSTIVAPVAATQTEDGDDELKGLWQLLTNVMGILRTGREKLTKSVTNSMLLGPN